MANKAGLSSATLSNNQFHNSTIMEIINDSHRWCSVENDPLHNLNEDVF